MKQTAFFFIIFVLTAMAPYQIKATGGNLPTGANAAGMSNAVVMYPSLWSVFHNQAGLAWLQNPAVGLSYGNEYFVSELSTMGLAAAYPTNSGTFGLSMSYFGFSQYNETKFGLAYAKKLGQNFAAGIQLDYFNTHIGEDYGNKGIPVAEIGIMAQPITNLWIGMHLFNPWQAKLADYNDERLQSALRFGVGYHFTDHVIWTVETEKSLEQKAVFRSGIDYKIIEQLSLRAGVQNNPQNISFGIGYAFKGLQMDFGFSHDYVLGFTSKLSLIYSFE